MIYYDFTMILVIKFMTSINEIEKIENQYENKNVYLQILAY